MEHKTDIKGYEQNFEQLAADIGDLRYDALAEFLELLGKKIEQDGLLDKDRGRVKLARNLDHAAKALLESAGQIKAAWVVCKPYM